jgi:hypothetical protein
VIHGKLKEAFLQGEEKEAANLFRQLLRQSVRAGLLEAMAEEVEALCGPRYRPDPESLYHRAGSESGKAPRVLESIKNILSIRSLAVTFDDWPQNASSPHSRPWCMAVILATAALSWSRRQWAQRVPPTRQLSE